MSKSLVLGHELLLDLQILREGRVQEGPLEHLLLHLDGLHLRVVQVARAGVELALAAAEAAAAHQGTWRGALLHAGNCRHAEPCFQRYFRNQIEVLNRRYVNFAA